jgi:hypothetical protein
MIEDRDDGTICRGDRAVHVDDCAHDCVVYRTLPVPLRASRRPRLERATGTR